MPSLYYTILGILDIFIGIFILEIKMIPYNILFYLGVIMLIKALLSIGGSFAARYWWDWMGFSDIISAIILLTGFAIPYFWIIMILKGSYSVVMGIAR